MRVYFLSKLDQVKAGTFPYRAEKKRSQAVADQGQAKLGQTKGQSFDKPQIISRPGGRSRIVAK